jgi:tRNA(adenine34) deaminase
MTASFTDPMRAALDEARAAALAGEVPVGAVVVCDGKILGAGRNRMRDLHDPTAHAEMVAMRAAAEARGSPRLDGCELWVTLEPCAMCAGAAALARISRLYFAAPDPKGGAVVHGPRLFDQPTCHHAPQVYQGMCEEEAGEMLRGFFKERRG